MSGRGILVAFLIFAAWFVAGSGLPGAGPAAWAERPITPDDAGPARVIGAPHTADQDGDGYIELTELLVSIQ